MDKLNELRDKWQEISFALKNKDSLYYDGYRAGLEECSNDLEALLNDKNNNK